MARGPEDGEDTMEKIGTTQLVVPGQKGKHISVVGYYPDDAQHRFRYELVDLDKERFKDTPKMLERMREYQHMLEANYDSVLKDFAKPTYPTGDTYAGVDSWRIAAYREKSCMLIGYRGDEPVAFVMPLGLGICSTETQP